MMLCLTTIACLAAAAAAQGPGSTNCPCASTTSWSAGATATSGGVQVLESTVGSVTTNYPITHGLDGCQSYSATNSPSCADLTTGIALTNRPAWCEDAWCYVDGANCQIAGGAITSSLFPNAFLSYQTCASAAGVSTNSYENLAVGSGVTELTGIVENYLYASAAEAERVAAATATAGTYTTCDAAMSCPCNRCETSDDWHCSGDVDFKSANLYYRTKDCPGNDCTRSASANQMKCMAGQVGNVFTRVADKEMGEDTSRIGFQFFADQASGGMLNWPAVDWCHMDSYEPRFRPWYSQAASGPKDVVIVIDISGSMGAGRRIEMAKEAVAKVIDTLTWSDHGSLVLFDDSTVTYECEDGGIMCAMTKEEKDLMKDWASENIAAMGGTNFDGAFAKAFQALQSSTTSACNKAILFMTDGQSQVNYATVRQNSVTYGTRVMTYALGSGAQEDACKRLACENGGVFTKVGDNDDLGLAMASYYKVFAAGMSRTGAKSQCSITWSNYMGGVTPVEFLSACLPVFKTQPGEATCGGAAGAAGTADADAYAELLGVVCMDLAILADLAELREEDEWESWYQSSVIDASCACPDNTLNHAQMQAVRASIAGAQQCEAADAMYDNTDRSGTPGVVSTCGNGIEPVNGATTCGMKTWIIVVIVLAVVAGCFCLLAVAGSCCKQTKAPAPAPAPYQYGGAVPMATATVVGGPPGYGQPAVAHVTPAYGHP